MMKLVHAASALFLFQSRAIAVRDGYDLNFLGDGFEVPLPTFSSNLQADVLQEPSTWLPYIHYSVATNKDRRQPICIALNIDLNLMKSAYRGDFIEDDRIGAPFQLNNDYYKNNEWDRGHMARRSSASWGETEEDAQDASDDTMFYTNSCLQHENLNQDEWLALEDWVLLLENTDNGRISTFTGPIYGYKDGVKEYLKPSGRKAAEIPAAFYKVVAFIGMDTQKIHTRAFIMIQNNDTLKDKSARDDINLNCYQVSVKTIEEATGLNFPTMLDDTNPIVLPSDCPSEAPSPTISFRPSDAPSTDTSSAPSEFPTVNPSGNPSALPTLPSSAPSEAPSSAPSFTPSAGPCLNDQNYRYKSNARKTCQWIGLTEDRRKTHCMHIEVHQNCPHSCGACCDDDPDYKFSTPEGPTRGCAWIAKNQSMKERWCDKWKTGMQVKYACPSACNFCFGFIKYKTLEPSGFPTYSPSKSLSRMPSNSPSNLPTDRPTVHPFARPSANPSRVPSNEPSSISTPKPTQPDLNDYSQIFIAAACINARGEDEIANEWVSVANYSPNTVDLDGWTISDAKRDPPLRLSGTLRSGETIRLGPLKSDDGGSVILTNGGGKLTMKDSNNRVINNVQWVRQRVDGSVKVFV